jgi:hypothetical protein
MVEDCCVECRKVAMQIEARGVGPFFLRLYIHELKVAFHKAELNWEGLR